MSELERVKIDRTAKGFIRICADPAILEPGHKDSVFARLWEYDKEHSGYVFPFKPGEFFDPGFCPAYYREEDKNLDAVEPQFVLKEDGENILVRFLGFSLDIVGDREEILANFPNFSYALNQWYFIGDLIGNDPRILAEDRIDEEYLFEIYEHRTLSFGAIFIPEEKTIFMPSQDRFQWVRDVVNEHRFRQIFASEQEELAKYRENPEGYRKSLYNQFQDEYYERLRAEYGSSEEEKGLS